jgi:molybdate transport system ATP-binding protein
VVERIRDELKLPVLYVSHEMREVERLTGDVIRLG